MVKKKTQYAPKSPREIRFTFRQTLWVLQNLPDLTSGFWPSDPEEIGRKVISLHAPFITASECAAEVRERLQRCGVDGLILLASECWGESYVGLSLYLNKPQWSIAKRRKKALGYVASGYNRRWHTTKKREGVTYEEFKTRPRKERL